MTITITALALFGLLLALLIRFRAVGVPAAVVALLFGFYLSRTGAADSIDQIMTALADAVNDAG
ncbi:hypothetical protein GCM10010400_09880 [Streptomyces aculeolatus]|uniref:hypothetical protein n=1 Tax=Streptomyces TaxID=1883 RepID=UPI001199529A|nr:hypothetical protein [Streptomyces aculeolatus]